MKMKKRIESIHKSYENFLVKFRNDSTLYYISINDLNKIVCGLPISGEPKLKRTRVWFILD